MATGPTSCPPPTFPISELKQLKAASWRVADADRRQTLALALMPCLADPNPQMRDAFAFEGLSALMRSKQLTTETHMLIYRAQLAQLQTTVPDPGGFAKPFAALALAEVARADRLQAFLDPEQRQVLVDAAAEYMRSIDDYRGFTTGEGWRHGVAHGADLLMQLSLNPAINTHQLDRMVRVAAAQIAPNSEHFYIYGEGDRLARPVLFAARRGLLDRQYWVTLITGLASPQPLASWAEAFETQAGLARLHNTKAFLRSLAAATRSQADASIDALLNLSVTEALAKLP